MDIKNPNAKWRRRFLEIARQVEASASRAQHPAAGHGLRPRSRMAGFALLRRGRTGVVRTA